MAALAAGPLVGWAVGVGLAGSGLAARDGGAPVGATVMGAEAIAWRTGRSPGPSTGGVVVAPTGVSRPLLLRPNQRDHLP